MAPTNTPGKKRRENNYFQTGVQGRKTGITLKDRGIRDEHGMEPIDGIFSSPEKSPPKRAPPNPDDTIATSEDMDVQTSSMPDPVETLRSRNLLEDGKKLLRPPPMARSPMKTALGSSPRRQSSMGPIVRRLDSSSPQRASSHPAVKRRLNFTADSTQGSIEENPASPRGLARRQNGRKTPDIFDMPVSPVRGHRMVHTQTLIEDESFDQDTSELERSEEHHGSPLVGDDDSVEIVPEDGQEEASEPEVLPPKEPSPVPKRRRRSRRSNVANADVEQNSGVEVTESPVETAKPAKLGRGGGRRAAPESTAHEAQGEPEQHQAKGRRGRKPGGRKLVQQPLPEVRDEPDPEIEVATAPSKPRGRRSKGKPPAPIADSGDVPNQSELDQEAASEPSSVVLEQPPNPPKRKRRLPKDKQPEPAPNAAPSKSSQKAKEGPERPAKRPRTKSQVPPSARSPNAKIISQKKKATVGEAKVTPEADSTGLMPPPSTRRQTQIVREQTPMDESGAHTTRSGRVSFQPVKWWLNERIEYDNNDRMTILNIKRVEEVAQSLPTKRKPRPGRRTREMSTVEEEDEQLEDWEVEGRVLSGFVRTWDGIAGQEDGGEMEERIAYPASAIITRDVANARFKYAKMVNLPFFGAGMVDLGPGDFKRQKNTRRMHMVFYVFTGRVKVTVEELEFIINKGGCWQVPRGNFYSIANESDRPARIFFAQGCEVMQEEEASQT